MPESETPLFCNYDNSNYQQDFWGEGKRAYEDASEAIALKKLLPAQGNLLLEIGAGAGRNTPRYEGYKRIVLMDYALTQMQQAQAALGKSERYVYVAADVYHLPFADSLFDGSTMIRVIHHLSELPPAFKEIERVLQTNATFILEYANKRNLKAILRYLTGKQSWNPMDLRPVEFVKLNFSNHPKTVERELTKKGFSIKRVLSVSNLRISSLKNEKNLGWMLKVERFLQDFAGGLRLSPSIFLQTILTRQKPNALPTEFFRCPNCSSYELVEEALLVHCHSCGRDYPIVDGIYDFRLK
jgi:ubiquinone/menaquinone biosynthesis C-methylase UbiE